MSNLALATALVVMGSIFMILYKQRFWKIDVILTTIWIVGMVVYFRDFWFSVSALAMLATLGAVVVGKLREHRRA